MNPNFAIGMCSPSLSHPGHGPVSTGNRVREIALQAGIGEEVVPRGGVRQVSYAIAEVMREPDFDVAQSTTERFLDDIHELKEEGSEVFEDIEAFLYNGLRSRLLRMAQAQLSMGEPEKQTGPKEGKVLATPQHVDANHPEIAPEQAETLSGATVRVSKHDIFQPLEKALRNAPGSFETQVRLVRERCNQARALKQVQQTEALLSLLDLFVDLARSGSDAPALGDQLAQWVHELYFSPKVVNRSDYIFQVEMRINRISKTVFPDLALTLRALLVRQFESWLLTSHHLRFPTVSQLCSDFLRRTVAALEGSRPSPAFAQLFAQLMRVCNLLDQVDQSRLMPQLLLLSPLAHLSTVPQEALVSVMTTKIAEKTVQAENKPCPDRLHGWKRASEELLQVMVRSTLEEALSDGMADEWRSQTHFGEEIRSQLSDLLSRVVSREAVENAWTEWDGKPLVPAGDFVEAFTASLFND